MKKQMHRWLTRIGGWMDDLLFPEAVLCLCCDRAIGLDAVDGVCPSCCAALERLAQRQEERERDLPQPLPAGIDALHAAFVYEGQARRLIHHLKYHSVRAAAVPLARRMAYLPSGEEEILVPVPTDRRREMRRGFNQSTLLAQEIGGILGMDVVTALTRIERRRPQTGLRARERRENVMGCMAASDAVSGKSVMLVDDVCTTGATVSEAARALRAAGARHVSVFAAARPLGDQDEIGDPFALPARD